MRKPDFGVSDQQYVHVEKELYYPCSENKGADQLCSYCLFSHMQKSGSLVMLLICPHGLIKLIPMKQRCKADCQLGVVSGHTVYSDFLSFIKL